MNKDKIKKMVHLILNGDRTYDVCDIVSYIKKEKDNDTNHSKNNS